MDNLRIKLQLALKNMRRKSGAIALKPVSVGWFASVLVLIVLFWLLASSETVKRIDLFIQFVTLAVLAATAFILFRNFTAIKTGSDQEFLRAFFERYESNEMYQSITAISDFGRNHTTDLKKFRRLLEADNPEITDEVETIALRIVANMESDAQLGRRRVLNLYKHPWRMCEEGYLNSNALKLIAETNAARILYPTIMPASAAVHLVDVCKLNREQFLNDRERFFWIMEFRTWRHRNLPPAFWDEPA